MTEVSLQLWSVQDDCGKDFLGTLTKVKEFGYDGVEFAGYYGVPAVELKAHLDKLGLKVSGSHIGSDQLFNNLEDTIAYEQIIDNKNVIIPWIHGETMAFWKESFQKISPIAKRLHEAGLVLGYHNHAHEFTEIPETNVLEEMVKEIPGLKLEVDTYWVEHAGVNALEWLTKNQDSVGWLHIKDMLVKGEEKESTEIGSGVLPIATYVTFARKAGINWLVVEQEAFQNYTPMESAELNVRKLRQLILEDAK